MSPEEYVSFDDLQKCKVLNLVEEFEEELIHMSGQCMDIGCGPGDVTKNILLPALDPNAKILGTDVSKNMIDFAKKTYGNENRLKFEVLDIQTRSLPEKYISGFDHIFSFHALNWCYNIQQAIENIYYMLRPGGSILLLIVATHDIFEVMKIMARDIRFAPYIQDVKKYVSPFNDSAQPRRELRELLKDIGFEVHHCSLRETTYSSRNSNDFLSSIISIYPFLDEMSPELKEEFKNEFTRKFEERKITYKTIQNNQEQTFVLDLYKILIVNCTKSITTLHK